MDTRLSLAVALDMFSQKFNCAESALGGLAKEFDFECDCIPRIATPFGGGVASNGDICGALTGAIMALGIVYGRNNSQDLDSKTMCYKKTDELLEKFRNKYSSVRCVDLIGVDLRTDEGKAKAQEMDTHSNICPKFVKFAVETVAELIENK